MRSSVIMMSPKAAAPPLQGLNVGLEAGPCQEPRGAWLGCRKDEPTSGTGGEIGVGSIAPMQALMERRIADGHGADDVSGLIELIGRR